MILLLLPILESFELVVKLFVEVLVLEEKGVPLCDQVHVLLLLLKFDGFLL